MSSTRKGSLTRNDREAFKSIGLFEEPDTYTVLDVDARWRILRSQLHPDKPGGVASQFDAARKAYDAARFYALEPKPCGDCDGHGKVQAPSQRGSFTATLMINCSTCKGSGRK